MRIVVLLILTLSIVFAKDKDTCYSVQLTSFVKKENSVYDFEAQNYPESCKLFSFSNVNTVRCGCFEKYGKAKKQQKVFEQRYNNTLIVSTYKYRFAPKKSMETKDVSKTIVENNNLSEDTTLEPEEQESILESITVQGHVNLAAQRYLTKPSGKHASNYTASAELEMAYNKEALKAFAKIRAQQDYYDLQGRSAHNDRSYLRLQELYMKYDLENSQLFFGKNIRFWGRSLLGGSYRLRLPSSRSQPPGLGLRGS